MSSSLEKHAHYYLFGRLCAMKTTDPARQNGTSISTKLSRNAFEKSFSHGKICQRKMLSSLIMLFI